MGACSLASVPHCDEAQFASCMKQLQAASPRTQRQFLYTQRTNVLVRSPGLALDCASLPHLGVQP